MKILEEHCFIMFHVISCQMFRKYLKNHTSEVSHLICNVQICNGMQVTVFEC